MVRTLFSSLLAVAGLLALAGPASPQALVAKDGSLLTLDVCRIRATIEEGVALVDVDQVFRNGAFNDREGSYRIRLPRDCVIHSFSMWINGREKQGRVLEAKSARQVYDRLVRMEKNPALLEQEGWRTFRVSVYPIPARDVVRIRLRYAYVLPDDLGLQTLEIPMLEDVGEIGEIVVQVEASGRRDLARFECASHPSAKATVDGNHGQIVWTAEKYRPLTPFIVRLLPRHEGLDLTVLTHREQDAEEGFFLVRVLPQLDAPKPLPRDVVFVMDRSGSMKGRKMEQAKQALLHGLATLRPGDRFNIVSFSTTTRLLKTRTMLPVDDDSLGLAKEEVGAIEAGGSTNIDQALSRALALRDPESTRLFLVVFLTDGIPTVGEKAPNKIIEKYREASGGKVRLFAFGVGDGVKDFLLTHLARGSRGTAVYVREDEDLELKLSTLFTKVGRPLLADPEIRIAGAETLDVIPDPLPDLYRGEALVLAGRYREGGKVELQLSGRLGSGRVIVDLPAEFPSEPVSRPHVAQLWAKMKIDQLLDDLRVFGLVDEIKQSIIDLGVRYQVVTPYTSFLVVEDDVHIPDPAEMAKVPEADGDAPADKPDGPGGAAPAAPVAKAPATGGDAGSDGGGDAEQAPDMRNPSDPPPPSDESPPPPPEQSEAGGETDPGQGGSYRGTSGGVPASPRHPASEQPPPPPAEDPSGDSGGADAGRPGGSPTGGSAPSSPGAASPGVGGVSTGPGGRKNTRREVVLPESWEFWWAHNRDHVLRLGSGLRPPRATGDGERPTDVVVDRILPALEAVMRKDSRVPAMQAEVALSLAKLGASRPAVAPRVALRLLELVRDGRPVVADSAVTSLGVLGHADEEVVATLIDLATRKLRPAAGTAPASPAREDLRGRAAIALGMLAVPAESPLHGRILFALKRLLEDEDSSANLRVSALTGLGLCADPGLVPGLEPWMKWHRGTADGDLVGSHALAAIARILARRPDDPAPLFTHLAKGVLMGEQHARAAVTLMGELGGRPEFRGKVPSAVLRALDRTLRRGEPQAAALALIALGKIGGTADVGKVREFVFDRLRTELRKGDGTTRPYAALALGIMGRCVDTPEDARRDMREVMRLNFEKKAHRVEPRDLGAYAVSLGLLEDGAVRPELRRLAKDRGEPRRLRGSATLALGLIRDGEDVLTMKSLLEARGQEDRMLRHDTCVAAGLHGDLRYVPVLDEILRDPKTTIFNQLAAAQALVQIGAPETVETLIKLVRAEKASRTNRAIAVAALGMLVDASEVPPLRRLAAETNHRALTPTLEAILRAQ